MAMHRSESVQDGGGQAMMINFEDGWKHIEQQAVQLLLQRLNNTSSSVDSKLVNALVITNEEYMTVYTMIERLCFQPVPFNFAGKLYDEYTKVMYRYVNDVTFPTLYRHRQGIEFLKSFVTQWSLFTCFTHHLRNFFAVLEDMYCAQENIPGLQQVAYGAFRECVFDKLAPFLRSAVTKLVIEQRDGTSSTTEQVSENMKLLRKVMNIGDLVCPRFVWWDSINTTNDTTPVMERKHWWWQCVCLWPISYDNNEIW